MRVGPQALQEHVGCRGFEARHPGGINVQESASLRFRLNVMGNDQPASVGLLFVDVRDETVDLDGGTGFGHELTGFVAHLPAEVAIGVHELLAERDRRLVNSVSMAGHMAFCASQPTVMVLSRGPTSVM